MSTLACRIAKSTVPAMWIWMPDRAADPVEDRRRRRVGVRVEPGQDALDDADDAREEVGVQRAEGDRVPEADPDADARDDHRVEAAVGDLRDLARRRPGQHPEVQPDGRRHRDRDRARTR